MRNRLTPINHLKKISIITDKCSPMRRTESCAWLSRMRKVFETSTRNALIAKYSWNKTGILKFLEGKSQGYMQLP